MFEHHQRSASVCEKKKTRPASQALCAGWNRFSVPGMHFTLSASDARTAASCPQWQHDEGAGEPHEHATYKNIENY